MVSRLTRAGIAGADGFALNVSNYVETAETITYGRDLSERLGGKHFVIDTSRNGNGIPVGSNGDDWCNPAGRALGQSPRAVTDNPAIDAYLWIKIPGESDGSAGDADTDCHGGPTSGKFWPEYAIGLAKGQVGAK